MRTARALIVRLTSAYGVVMMASLGVAAVTFLANIGLARVAGAEFYGKLVVWISWCLLLGGLANMGMPTFLLRTLSSNDAQTYRNQGVINTAVLVSFALHVLLCVPVVTLIYLLPNTPDVGFLPYLFATLVVAVSGTMMRIGGMILRAEGRPLPGIIFEQGWRPIALLAIIAALFVVPLDFLLALTVVSLTGVLASTIAGYITGVGLSKMARTSREQMLQAGRLGAPFWFTNFASTLIRRSDVIIVGILLGPVAAGVYGVAFRFSELPGLLTNAINLIIGPKFSSIAHLNKRGPVVALLKEHVLVSLMICLPGIVVLYFAADPLLDLVGPEFTTAADVFRLLLFAVVVNLGSRAFALYMNMSGYERLLAKINAGFVPIHIGLMLVLTVYFGLIGAAIARILGLLLQRCFIVILALRHMPPA